jgi:hypothetical protein
VWTGTWRDPRFSPPADGGKPENALTGTIFGVDAYRKDPMIIPAEYGNLRFWRNTEVASLPQGGEAVFSDGTLGHEWDEDLDNGSRPPGLIHLSSTSHNVDRHMIDYGNTFVPDEVTHHLTLYRHASGALVFGAGTVQWAWGLDANHDTFDGEDPPSAEHAMRQATVNLFADMGNVQPATLQGGLTPATKSTDTTPPTSVVTSPANGTQVQSGVPVTITGTASDTGGGVVAGVEVSVDGGLTWRRATGRTSWSYEWVPAASGPANLESRAIDDSANIEPSGSPPVDPEIPALGPGLPVLALLLALLIVLGGRAALRPARSD